MSFEFLEITPVLPSADVKRDIEWYEQKVGFTFVSGDQMYAILKRRHLYIHLQWHADTTDDPLLGGSVIRIFVRGIQFLFQEFVDKGILEPEKLRMNTLWGTHEFGLFDLNQNVLFFVEDVK